jgi:hypothetical protein
MKIYFKWLFLQILVLAPFAIFLFIVIKYLNGNIYLIIPTIILGVISHVLATYYAEKKGIKKKRVLYISLEEHEALEKLKVPKFRGLQPGFTTEEYNKMIKQAKRKDE